MSIQPTPAVAPALKVEDWDFNAGRYEVSVKVAVGDLCGITLTAHWEQFCEWCVEEYALAGSNWRTRTFTVLVERPGTRWDEDEYDLDEVAFDAVEWLDDNGFGEDEQRRFFREIFGQAANEAQ